MATEQLKSPVRLDFEANVQAHRWKEAYLNFNGLNMYEMRRAYRDLDSATRTRFWSQKDKTTGNPPIPNTQADEIPRMEYAVNVVDAAQMPSENPPGDLTATGQEEDAREFLASMPDGLARLLSAISGRRIHEEPRARSNP
jgi:hypothetical protein